MRTALDIWTVYDHPADYPNAYIARRAEVGLRTVTHTSQIIIDPDLDRLRRELSSRGLTLLSRDPNDDPKIVEVWL